MFKIKIWFFSKILPKKNWAFFLTPKISRRQIFARFCTFTIFWMFWTTEISQIFVRGRNSTYSSIWDKKTLGIRKKAHFLFGKIFEARFSGHIWWKMFQKSLETSQFRIIKVASFEFSNHDSVGVKGQK